MQRPALAAIAALFVLVSLNRSRSASTRVTRGSRVCPRESVAAAHGWIRFALPLGWVVIHNGGMSTPSERIWLGGNDPVYGRSLAFFLPTRARSPVTLAEAGRRIGDGTTLRAAVADFLDDLRFARDGDDAADRIHEEPATLDSHSDAYLAAVAEHVAASRGLRVPPWTRRTARFLDHFWWPSTTPALHARALVESPAAFRRRGIFIGRTTLKRV